MKKKPELMELAPSSAVVIICGGNGVTYDDLATWKKQFDL